MRSLNGQGGFTLGAGAIEGLDLVGMLRNFDASFVGAGVKTVDLAAGSGLTVWGASAGDLAGFAVGAARLNEDSAADVIIGAFWAAGPGEVRPMAGEVYVIHGGHDRLGAIDQGASYRRSADDDGRTFRSWRIALRAACRTHRSLSDAGGTLWC